MVGTNFDDYFFYQIPQPSEHVNPSPGTVEPAVQLDNSNHYEPGNTTRCNRHTTGAAAHRALTTPVSVVAPGRSHESRQPPCRVHQSGRANLPKPLPPVPADQEHERRHRQLPTTEGQPPRYRAMIHTINSDDSSSPNSYDPYSHTRMIHTIDSDDSSYRLG